MTTMTRYFLAATLSILCLSILFSQARAQEGEAQAIAFARQINVSQLDPALPHQRLDDWIQALAGPKATVTWEVNDCGEQTGTTADLERDIPSCAQAEAKLADNRTIVIMIAVGTVKKGLSGKPEVFHISVGQNGRFSTVKRLSELESVVEKGPAGTETLPDEGRYHLEPGERWEYKSVPPTSGPHDPKWVKAGFYRTPQPLGKLVHSLEHGCVVIYYDRPAPDVLATLKEWAKRHPGKWDGVIVTPLRQLGKAIVLTAWRKRLRLDPFDQARAEAFLEAFRGHGPESGERDME